MDPWMAELIKDSSGVILGWALGLGSALLVDWRKDMKKVGSVKTAISRELREVAYRLLALAYKVEGRRGRIDRQLLEWMHPHVQRYAGPNPSEGILSGVEGLLTQSDEELAKLAAYMQANTPPQFWPREEPGYTAAAVAEAHQMDPDYAVRVLDILSHIRMLNDGRENGLYYTRLTFAAGITEENHAKAVQNADRADDQMAKRARIIVDKITALEQKYPGGP